MPRLHEFVRDNVEEILKEWESFARTLPGTQAMDVATLRDHAREMLLVIAKDLETPQTAGEASAKSKGESDAGNTEAPATAAQEHGAGRAVSGFTVAQMLSELRALRASVLRLWTKAQTRLEATDIGDMTRFNEAIDQIMAESVMQYSDDIGQSKERFLAILGHDLRNPIGAISMSATFMLDTGELPEPHRTLVQRIDRSARRMAQMVKDLLDFTQTRFGDAIPITRASMDANRMVRDVVAEVLLRYPDSSISVDAKDELRGDWDCARLTQALTNLVTNAVEHGAAKSRIKVVARRVGDEAAISVQNMGPVIRQDDMAQLFQAGPKSDAGNADGHLGLGLYIVDRIVAAHGGRIDVRSNDTEGTTFTIHLPRAV
jgi:signal transduction histidine kinase